MLHLISSIGLMFILKYGTILDKPRHYIKSLHSKFAELFECSLCLGFWSGLFIAGFTDEYVLSFAFASAAICFFADTILLILQGINNDL